MKKFILALSLFASLGASAPSAGEPSTGTTVVGAPSAGAPAVYPVAILGGGMGALTSAVYLGRAGVEPLVIEGKLPGGLLTQSHSVQNWPGELEIEGAALANKVRHQAEVNGARFIQEEVIGVDFSKRPFLIRTKSLDGRGVIRETYAESCIIAMGTQPNLLHVPGESGPNGYWGRGVTNCAICDGNLYRGKKVGVVGGGDSAVLEALYLSPIASEVVVFVRGDQLRAHEKKRVETLLKAPNVKIFYNAQVQEIKGDSEKLTHVVLNREGKIEPHFPLDGLFLAIGSMPNSEVFKEMLQLDERGYISLSKDQQTSIEGVYAIGDIVDPVYKQAISAAGDGAKAALQAQQFLSDHFHGLAQVKKGQEAPSAIAQEVIEIATLEQFKKELSGSDVPVVVDFYASWCGPCKRISPVLESSANLLSGKVKFLKVNVDLHNELSTSYGIRAMPTVLLFDAKGTLLSRKVGADQIFDLLQQLEKEPIR